MKKKGEAKRCVKAERGGRSSQGLYIYWMYEKARHPRHRDVPCRTVPYIPCPTVWKNEMRERERERE